MKAANIGLTAVVLLCSACQTTLLSNDRIAASTAGILGVPVSEVRISDRRTDGPTNTVYVATTRQARYACVINGGGLLAAGITNPPVCNKS